MKAKNYVWLMMLSSLAGCDFSDKPESKASVRSDLSPALQQVPASESADLAPMGLEAEPAKLKLESSRYVTDSDNIRSLREGAYELVVLPGEIDLLAHKAERQAIIRDLSNTLPFDLIVDQAIEGFITIEAVGFPLPQVLSLILDGNEYQSKFAADGDELGYRLRSVSVGPEPLLVSEAEISPESSLPEEPVYLGSAPRKVDLVERLFSSDDPEVRALAVRELRMNPRGFNAAVQAYRTDDDGQVRLAVLELISSEEYFMAKQMVVEALSDSHIPTVLHALKAIESQHDFSLVHYIEKLNLHPSSEVQQRAREVSEALTSAYPDPDRVLPQDTTQMMSEDELKGRAK